VATATIQCTAEAEGLLVNAERAKAITPLCMGIGTTCTTFFTLLVHVFLVDSLTDNVTNKLFLCCPLVSVLGAAVASLSLQKTKCFCQRATKIGIHHFAKSGLVGRTWLSTTEQIIGKSSNGRSKWCSFCLSVLPAPILGALVPGASLATK
jgi:hypothetical protein